MLKMIKVMKVSRIQDQDWHKKLQSKSLLIWMVNTLNKMETFSWLFGEGFASNIFSIRIPASSSDSRMTIFRTLKHLEKTIIINIWVEKNPIYLIAVNTHWSVVSSYQERREKAGPDWASLTSLHLSVERTLKSERTEERENDTVGSSELLLWDAAMSFM